MWNCTFVSSKTMSIKTPCQMGIIMKPSRVCHFLKPDSQFCQGGVSLPPLGKIGNQVWGNGKPSMVSWWSPSGMGFLWTSFWKIQKYNSTCRIFDFKRMGSIQEIFFCFHLQCGWSISVSRPADWNWPSTLEVKTKKDFLDRPHSLKIENPACGIVLLYLPKRCP